MLNTFPCHKTLPALFVFFLFFLPGIPATAENSATASAPGRFISPSEQLAFADRYFDNGQYDRAAAEYERFIFFFPDDPRATAARYGMGQSYYKLGEYAHAQRIFSELIPKNGDIGKNPEPHFGLSRCCMKLGDVNCALRKLEQVITLTDENDIRDRAWYDMGWIFAEKAQWKSADTVWNRISPDNRTAYNVESLAEKLGTAQQIKQKNPKIAGALSIIPGGGYFYCSRYKDALTAFLLNGGLVLAAWSSFENGNPALGGVISFVEAGFYGGNIYGGINCAHKFNERQTDKFLDDLKKDSRMRLSMDFENERIGLAYEKEF